MQLANRWRAVDASIDAADPGALRRYHAARTALAAVTAWLIMRILAAQFAGTPLPAVGLFAVTICFICALVVVDARRTERRLTLLLSVVVVALALLLASLLSAVGWLYPFVLLALIFGSYAVRRWGVRPGELLLLLTMGLYFAQNARVRWDNVGWFLLAAAVGVVSLWLWQFVILPYNPVQALRACVRSFYDRAAGIVDCVGAGLEQAPGDEAVWVKELQRQLQLLRLSRRAIESQFPGALAPDGWTAAQMRELGVALYTAEQGLVQLVEGAANGTQLAGAPAEVRTLLADGLHALHAALLGGSADNMQRLADESAALRAYVRDRAGAGLAANPDGAQGELAPWVGAALRLVSGSYQVARSISQVRMLAAATRAAPAVDGSAAAGAPTPPLPPLLRVFGKLNLHPTTALGLQAVVATGLAMLVARLLNLDHSNWVFWTAFVVIAGSTGDSLRKMTMRVAGTVGGAVVGVALALMAPDDTLLIVLVAIACIYLTIYFAPVSYPQMVFWLNIGFVMVYTRLGADEIDLLVARPSTTLVGALVAALVVLFVFPIHVTERFKLAAARFLSAVDAYVAAFVVAMTGGASTQSLAAMQAQVAAAYGQVEQTLPGVAFENNPLVQADSPLTGQAARLGALEAEIAQLAQIAAVQETQSAATGAVQFLRSTQARIHQNIQAIVPLLSGGQRNSAQAATRVARGEPQPASQAHTSAVADLADESESGEGGENTFRADGGLALLRIHGIVKQLAAELGAPVKAEFSRI